MNPNSNYNTLGSTTLKNFANNIFDNVITNNAALNELHKAGNIKVVGGGRSFTHPVYYQGSTNFGAISKYGTVPTDLQEPLTRAEYEIKTIAGSIVLSMVEEAMNSGNREKLIDYVESLKTDAETKMGETMGDQLFTAEASLGDDDMDSIPYIISNDPTARTGNHVGDISCNSATGNSYWANYTDTGSCDSFLSSTTTGGLFRMDAMLNGCTFGRQGPTFIVTTKAVYALYNATLQANVRYTSLEKGEAGFRNLLYATMPMYFDDNCPATNMYFIDGNSLKLQVLSKGNMKMTPFVQAYSQLMERAILYSLTNVTCGSRRTQGVFTKITA